MGVIFHVNSALARGQLIGPLLALPIWDLSPQAGPLFPALLCTHADSGACKKVWVNERTDQGLASVGDGTEPKNAFLVLSAPGFLQEHRLREAERGFCLHAVVGFCQQVSSITCSEECRDRAFNIFCCCLLEDNCFTILCWPLPFIIMISHRYTYVPSLLNPPPISHPSHPSGLSQSTGLSSLCHTANSYLLSTLHMVMYIFPCYSCNSFHPLLPLLGPHDCSLGDWVYLMCTSIRRAELTICLQAARDRLLYSDLCCRCLKWGLLGYSWMTVGGMGMQKLTRVGEHFIMTIAQT